jgi:putative membrane protein
MMTWYGGSGGWIGCWVMVLVMIAFWALLITGLIALVRYVLSSSRGAGAATSLVLGSAEDVLAQRYTRGEIDDVQYQRSLAFVRQNTSER